VDRPPGRLSSKHHSLTTSAPKASAGILEDGCPDYQSIRNTVQNNPPPRFPFTREEQQIMEKLDRNIFKVVTPVKVEALELLTRDHPNRPYVDYILTGLKEGFRYGFQGVRRKTLQQNLASIQLDERAFERAIEKEVRLGRYAGPFDVDNPPCELFCVNPCGLVPKKGAGPIEYRVISHQSAPSGSSVNDGIDKNDFTTAYENINHAAKWVRKQGQGCQLLKLDIKEAYRILPVHPVDQVLQGIVHKGKLYFDRCVAFGNRASAGIFCRLADLVTWIAAEHGIESIIHYIDDFLIVVSASPDAAMQVLRLFMAILDIIGIPYKREKTEGPTTELTYLGVRLNTVNMSAYVPVEKRRQIVKIVQAAIGKTCMHLRELQSVIGCLMWLTQVTPHGRVFIQSLINKTKGKWKGSSWIRLDKRCTDDLKWWLDVIPGWDGIRLLEEVEWRSSEMENLFTNASDWGGGATFGNFYTFFPWRSDLDLHTYNIQIRELYALLVAVLTFRRLWQRKRFLIRMDNMANVLALRKGACSNPLVMKLIRFLVKLQIKNDFSIRLVYINTHANTTADSLSRGGVATAGHYLEFVEPVVPEGFPRIAQLSHAQSNEELRG